MSKPYRWIAVACFCFGCTNAADHASYGSTLHSEAEAKDAVGREASADEKQAIADGLVFLAIDRPSIDLRKDELSETTGAPATDASAIRSLLADALEVAAEVGPRVVATDIKVGPPDAATRARLADALTRIDHMKTRLLATGGAIFLDDELDQNFTPASAHLIPVVDADGQRGRAVSHCQSPLERTDATVSIDGKDIPLFEPMLPCELDEVPLAMAVLAAMGHEPPKSLLESSTLRSGRRSAQRVFAIHFPSNYPASPQVIPIASLRDESFDPSVLRGKALVIGASMIEENIDRHFVEGRPIAGTLVHILAMLGLLADDKDGQLAGETLYLKL